MQYPTLSNPPLRTIQNASFSRPWFFTLASCFLILALLACRKNWDPDLGFHLKTGQWILQNHQIPSNDTFTYTVPDHPFLDIEWFYDFVLHLVFLAGSYSLLSIFNVVLILTAFFITWGRLRQTRCPIWMGVPLMAAAISICEFRFIIRPEILSWSLLGMMLWVLETWVIEDRNRLWLLPILQLIWVNTEGIFPIGLAVIGIFLISQLIHKRKIDYKLTSNGILAGAACLLNPYGIRGFLHPLVILKTIHTDIFKNNIMEFLSPWNPANNDLLSNPFWGYKCFCFFFLFLFLATLHRRKAHEFLLASFFFYLSATALRNIPLFLLACLPVVGVCWKDLPWPQFRKYQERFLTRPTLAWALSALLLCLGVRIFTNAYYYSDKRQEVFGLGINQERLPDAATDFLSRNRLDRTILCELSCGDWLDWKGPQKAFIDGRLEVIGESLFSQYLSSRQPGGLLSLAEQYHVDILFFTLPNQWVSDLQKTENWRPVFVDGTAAIYLRRGYAPAITAFRDTESHGSRRSPGEYPESGSNFVKIIAAIGLGFIS